MKMSSRPITAGFSRLARFSINWFLGITAYLLMRATMVRLHHDEMFIVDLGTLLAFSSFFGFSMYYLIVHSKKGKGYILLILLNFIFIDHHIVSKLFNRFILNKVATDIAQWLLEAILLFGPALFINFLLVALVYPEKLTLFGCQENDSVAQPEVPAA